MEVTAEYVLLWTTIFLEHKIGRLSPLLKPLMAPYCSEDKVQTP